VSSAREKAVSYLARFARSERQVRDYLKRKEYQPDEIADAVSYLHEHKFLNDSSYAEAVVRDRIRHGDGPLKIKQMLFQKGIDASTQERLLKEFYPQELQVETAEELVRKKMRRSADREKAMRFVASRGFSRYVMIQAFKNCMDKKES
jgi:regulatory protein